MSMTKAEFYEDIRAHIANIYSFPTEAKVIKVYTDKGKYYLDAKELDLDGSEAKVIYPKIEIPKIWGAKEGGLFCLPSKGSIVRINFKKGNKNFPYVESILGSDFDLEHKENEFILINKKQKLYFKENYVLLKAADNFLIELDKIVSGSEKISVIFNENIKLTASSTGWKLVTQNETFELSNLIELKNSIGSLKSCLDDLSDLINEVATITSTLSTTGSSTAQTAVAGQFTQTLIKIAQKKAIVATIFK